MSSPYVPLVSLASARAHLRLPEDTGSPVSDATTDLEAKLLQATEMIRQYLGRPTDATWTADMAAWDETTVPPVVAAAILVQLGELYRFRGDDPDTQEREPGFLSPMVRAYLARYRDPVMA